MSLSKTETELAKAFIEEGFVPVRIMNEEITKLAEKLYKEKYGQELEWVAKEKTNKWRPAYGNNQEPKDPKKYHMIVNENEKLWFANWPFTNIKIDELEEFVASRFTGHIKPGDGIGSSCLSGVHPLEADYCLNTLLYLKQDDAEIIKKYSNPYKEKSNGIN